MHIGVHCFGACVGQSVAAVADFKDTGRAVDVDLDALELIVALPAVHVLKVHFRTLDVPPFHSEEHGEQIFDMVAGVSDSWMAKIAKPAEMPDNLIELLLEEVRATLRADHAPRDGRHMCPLCPNRHF